MSNPTEILIVEDSATQAIQLREFLERNGYLVSVAPSGVAALDAIRLRPPTVVIADVVLPNMDGFELCRRIKAEKASNTIPVILITALSAPQDIICGVECGADNFVVKPYDEKKLLAAIRHVLANRELREYGSFEMGIDVSLEGERHRISASRVQLLDLLLASYEAAAENAEKLARAREIAERANREKSELLARLGHEFRAPLNAILGFAQILEGDGYRGANGERIQGILAEGGKLLRIADKMLDVARLDAGDLAVEEEGVDWREVILWCGDLVRPVATARSIEVNYRLGGEGVPLITADRERMSEVLLILLSNAVKFNRQGGKVTVSAEKLPGGKFLRLSIADTGMGIPEEKLDRLFVPFERLGVEHAGIEGVGIGLALARRLAQAMGGALHVESVAGIGSTFSLDLPIEQGSSHSRRRTGLRSER